MNPFSSFKLAFIFLCKKKTISFLMTLFNLFVNIIDVKIKEDYRGKFFNRHI